MLARCAAYGAKYAAHAGVCARACLCAFCAHYRMGFNRLIGNMWPGEWSSTFILRIFGNSGVCLWQCGCVCVCVRCVSCVCTRILHVQSHKRIACIHHTEHTNTHVLGCGGHRSHIPHIHTHTHRFICVHVRTQVWERTTHSDPRRRLCRPSSNFTTGTMPFGRNNAQAHESTAERCAERTTYGHTFYVRKHSLKWLSQDAHPVAGWLAACLLLLLLL